MLRTPKPRRPEVASLCRKLCPGSTAQLIENNPLPGKPKAECFKIVEEHVAAHGGKQRLGWAIFELKKVWLEAEFHAVWEREDGTLVDLTPRHFRLDHTLFLPDPKRQYEGRRVNSVYHAISKKPSVKRFIAMTKRHFALLNQPNLPDEERTRLATDLQHEMNELSERIIDEHRHYF